LDEARDLADRNGELYAWIYVYNDVGEILYEAGFGAQQLRRIEKPNHGKI